MIREERGNKGDISVVWLDLTHVYGSMPHKVVEETLKRDHVPEKVKMLIKEYYKQFFTRFTYNKGTASGNNSKKALSQAIHYQ